MKELKMQINKSLLSLLIEKIYMEELPFECVLGHTECFDQSVAGFANKQYMQELTVRCEEGNEGLFNKTLNDVICEFSKI